MLQNDIIQKLIEKSGKPAQIVMESIYLLEKAQKYLSDKNFTKAICYFEEAFAVNNYLEKTEFKNSYAHCLILATNWDKFNTYISDKNNYLQSSGWINSVWKNEPLNKNFIPVPWYTYPAIEFIEDKLKTSFKVFEFGSGFSTFWWASRVEEIFSVEHNPDFFLKLTKSVPSNSKISLIENLTTYALEITKYPDSFFDCIIIDGQNRNQCATFCINKLKISGFLIFDDSDNHLFNEGVNFLSHNGFKRIDFYGMIPCYTIKCCTSIFFRDDSFLINDNLPSQKESCLGKTYYQNNG